MLSLYEQIFSQMLLKTDQQISQTVSFSTYSADTILVWLQQAALQSSPNSVTEKKYLNQKEKGGKYWAECWCNFKIHKSLSQDKKTKVLSCPCRA